MPVESILDLIGQTSHVRMARLFPEHAVWIKQERSNPGGSIKDRIALAMIEAAEKSGELKKGSVIIEPTSGNTGVGLAMVAAVKGYRLILVMPESMSVERRRLMLAYGAEFDLTAKELGMKGALARAEALAEELQGQGQNIFMPRQFENPENVKIHTETTAQEIINDFPDGLDYLITGVGTGGHFTGVAKILKEKWPHLKAIAVEPSASPVLSGGSPAPHPIQGIGAGFVPDNMDLSLADDIIKVEASDAKKMARQAAQKEGMLVGISSGATLAAIQQALTHMPNDAKILGFNYDTGERYLSIADFLPEE